MNLNYLKMSGCLTFERLRLHRATNSKIIFKLGIFLRNLTSFLLLPRCNLCDYPSENDLSLCATHDNEFSFSIDSGDIKSGDFTVHYFRKYTKTTKELIVGAKIGSTLMEFSVREAFKKGFESNLFKFKNKFSMASFDMVVNIPGSKPFLIKSSLSLKLSHDAWKLIQARNLKVVFYPFTRSIFPPNWLFTKKQAKKKRMERIKSHVNITNHFNTLNILKRNSDQIKTLALRSANQPIKILLVDDILTSGESFKNFAAFLKNYLINNEGFKKIQIEGLVFAFTPPPDADKT